MKSKLTKQQLAQALGVSPPAFSRYVRAGCPVDSLEAARDWQHRHVNPLQRLLRGAGRMPAADPVAEVHRLMVLAADNFEGHAEQLRAALRAVPQHARADMQIDLTVMRRLLPAGLATELGGPSFAPDDGGGPDDEAEHVAAVLYGLACRELVWK